MLTNIVQSLGGWTWWVVGLILLGMEILLPGTFFLWFGVSALVVGLTAILVDWPWQAQIVTWLVLALILLVIGRRYFKGWGNRNNQDVMLNERAGRLLGTTYVLTEPIVDGRGRVRIDDTIWRISGPTLQTGRRIRIVAVEGAVLLVEPVD